MKNAINKNFEPTNIFHWSDSEISLYWIQSIEKGWERWVENRVNFILSLTDYKSRYYVSTKINSAVCLHLTVILKFTKNDLQWHGSKFLLKNSDNWPVLKGIDITKECKNEYYAECTTTLVQIVDSKSDSCFLENLIKIESFSSLKKLFRVIKRKLLKVLFSSMKSQRQNIYGCQMYKRKF